MAKYIELKAKVLVSSEAKTGEKHKAGESGVFFPGGGSVVKAQVQYGAQGR